MKNANEECYSNINNHPLTRLPDKILDKTRAVYVGANGKTKICKLIDDNYVVWDIYKNCPLKESYPNEVNIFCKFDEVIICRGLSSFDY